MRRCFAFLMLVLLLCAVATHVDARINPQKWGIALTVNDSTAIEWGLQITADSFLHIAPSNRRTIYYSIQRPRPFHNSTADFYLLCALCLLLGAIRYLDPRYFALLVGAYRNPGTGRQWHEMLQAAALPNLGMNVFYAAVVGAYIYYLSGGAESHLLAVRTTLALPLLIGGMLVIYAGKYAVIRFSGWAFRVETLAEQYLFNVFLVNKITGIVLLPFVFLIAFAGREWVQPIGIVSGVIALALLSTRYLRSWPAFFTFFQGSKFHFFTYLCASEILPMAVLVKWLLHLIR